MSDQHGPGFPVPTGIPERVFPRHTAVNSPFCWPRRLLIIRGSVLETFITFPVPVMPSLRYPCQFLLSVVQLGPFRRPSSYTSSSTPFLWEPFLGQISRNPLLSIKPVIS